MSAVWVRGYLSTMAWNCLRAAVARSCADAKLSDPGCGGTPAGRTGVSQVRTAVENSALAFSSCVLT